MTKALNRLDSCERRRRPALLIVAMLSAATAPVRGRARRGPCQWKPTRTPRRSSHRSSKWIFPGRGNALRFLRTRLRTLLRRPRRSSRWTFRAPSPSASVTLTRASGSLTASWPAVNGAVTHEIASRFDSESSWRVGAPSQSSANITITGVEDAAAYVVRVRSRKSGGAGAWRYSAPSCPQTLDCTAELDAVYFAINDDSIGNLGGPDTSTDCTPGHSSSQIRCAAALTTGGRVGGYVLSSMTARFGAKTGSPAALTVALHDAVTSNKTVNPGAAALVTLSGSDPDTAGLHSFTCSGSDCSLAPHTTDFVVMSTSDASGTAPYRWKTGNADGEARHPSDNGFSLAESGRQKLGTAVWTKMSSSRTAVMHVATNDDADTVRLAVSSVTSATATLTIANRTGNWYFKANAAPHANCLTIKAHPNVAKLQASSLTASEAGLSVVNHSGYWWHTRDVTNAICDVATPGGTATLTNLTGSTTYTYEAYSKAECADVDEFGAVTFTTPAT